MMSWCLLFNAVCTSIYSGVISSVPCNFVTAAGVLGSFYSERWLKVGMRWSTKSHWGNCVNCYTFSSFVMI